MAYTPLRSPGRRNPFSLCLPGKELCSPLLCPLGGHQGRRSSGLWREVRETCLVLGEGPRALSPSFPPSGGRAGCVRGGGGGCTAHPPWPGELVPGVVLAALSPALRFPPCRPSPREKWKRNWVCSERNRVGCFKMCLLRTWLQGAACATSELSFVFFLSA